MKSEQKDPGWLHSQSDRWKDTVLLIYLGLSIYPYKHMYFIETMRSSELQLQNNLREKVIIRSPGKETDVRSKVWAVLWQTNG